ncbi:hypothetical protein [Nonomuraea wenchangensis]|uniref:hypothetical protein n=1 Tax=Nonomuraea wenchangensis TaxID=568860 RepID=UPI003419A475
MELDHLVDMSRRTPSGDLLAWWLTPPERVTREPAQRLVAELTGRAGPVTLT